MSKVLETITVTLGLCFFSSCWVMMVATSCSNYQCSLQFATMLRLHYLQLLVVAMFVVGFVKKIIPCFLFGSFYFGDDLELMEVILVCFSIHLVVFN
jgi:hypothetical protein